MVNNYDWTHDLTLLDFLRDYGKNFNINTMLAKDIVSSRLDTGISFTEFTYQIANQWITYIYLNTMMCNYKLVVQISGEYYGRIRFNSQKRRLW